MHATREQGQPQYIAGVGTEVEAQPHVLASRLLQLAMSQQNGMHKRATFNTYSTHIRHISHSVLLAAALTLDKHLWQT